MVKVLVEWSRCLWNSHGVGKVVKVLIEWSMCLSNGQSVG